MANINISNETVILSKSAEDIESILSGYSDLTNSVLTEVLNRETADNELSLRISNINGVEYIQVDELPSEPLKDHFNAFYIVANGRKEDNNLFTEYYWKEGKWETFGSASLDLSSYVKKSEIDTTPTANSTNPITSGAVKTALDGKVDTLTDNGAFTVGRDANTIEGIAIGIAASTRRGVAISCAAVAEDDGIAIGEQSLTYGGIAIGHFARTFTCADNGDYIPIDAIQLGEGDNSNPYTMQVYDYKLLADDAKSKSATDGSKYLKDVGKLSSLATSVKDNIVNAINSIVTLLSQKVDKVNGKGLSANDYTNEEKEKLSKLPTKSELNSDLEGKQDKLTFDTTPTANSTNPVTSDGVANAVENLNVQIGAQLGTVLPLKADKTELADLKLKSIPHKDVSAYLVTLTDHLADEEFIKCNVYGNADGVGNLDSADGKYKIPITLTGKNLFNFGTTQGNWYIHDNTSSVSINTNDCVVSGKYGDGASNWVVNLNKIPVTTGKKYVVSYNSNFEASRALIRLLDINGNILTTGLSTGTYNSYYNAYLINNTAASNNDRVKVSFSVTNDNVYYILIGMVFMNQKDETMIQTFSKIQFELGEAATEYEDYTENTVTAVLDTALTAGEYIDIVNKKRYNGDTVTDITVNGSLKTTDSANNHISCDTAETPSKIELSYYQDVNKVLSEITNAVLAQGGDV